MAVSSAPLAGPKLLNLRSPALPSILRHQILHPYAAAASPAFLDPQSPNLIHMEKHPAVYFLHRYSSDGGDLNLQASDLPLSLQWPFGFSGMQIEAARTYVPRDDDIQDFEEDDDDDDNEDDDEDDVDIQDYSGSDFDDEGDDDGIDDDDRRCGRSY